MTHVTWAHSRVRWDSMSLTHSLIVNSFARNVIFVLLYCKLFSVLIEFAIIIILSSVTTTKKQSSFLLIMAIPKKAMIWELLLKIWQKLNRLLKNAVLWSHIHMIFGQITSMKNLKNSSIMEHPFFCWRSCKRMRHALLDWSSSRWHRRIRRCQRVNKTMYRGQQRFCNRPKGRREIFTYERRKYFNWAQFLQNLSMWIAGIFLDTTSYPAQAIHYCLHTPSKIRWSESEDENRNL